MGLRINTNLAAMTANRMISQATATQSLSYQRLASGQRIVHAADDAAGLSISESLRSQIRSILQADRNSNDGISYVQVAEGGLTEISNILIRLRELGIQASSDTIGDRERGYINSEAQSLIQEIDRIASVINFNRTPLLNGESSKNKLEFQIGIENKESSRITFDVNSLDSRSGTLGIDGINYESVENSRDAFEKVDVAIARVCQTRTSLAAMQANLQSTSTSLRTMVENLSSARSQIADADIAEETTRLVKNNILLSAGVSILAQANQMPAQALKLL